MIITYSDFRDQFVRRGLQSNLWVHPYFALITRQPTLLLLQEWAIQAGMIDEIFAEILATMLSNPVIPESAHASLRENRQDELGHGDPAKEHVTLFRHVLSELGVTEQRYRQTRALSGTAAILHGLRNAARGADAARILALMASEEFICPREFPILVAAMDVVLNGNLVQGREYFDVHCELDVGHSNDLISHLYEATGGIPHLIEQAATCQNEDLNWNYAFYDSLLLQHLQS